MTDTNPSTATIGNSKYQLKATGEAAKSYDFAKARPPAKTTNVIESIGHLIKSCLGGGIVAIHESYKQCGLWTSLVLNVVLGIFVAHCMFILARSAQKIYGRVQVPVMSYPDLAEAAFAVGPWPRARKYSKCFRYLVDVTITIDLFGACCVYLVVIARTIKQLMEGTDLTTDAAVGSSPAVRIYILTLLIPCLLICMITTLKYLAPFSLVADFFILIVTIATIYYGTKNAKISPLQMPIFKNWVGLFEFLGVCVFSMEGVGVTLAIENSMTEPKKILTVLTAGMAVVIALVICVGFFGYWGYGELAKSPVTLNFPWEPFPIALKAFMAIMIYVTFALNFWVPFNLVWHYLKKRHQPQKLWFWERVYRFIFVVGITGIAFLFPNINKLTALIGSFCLSNMGFIYPAIIELTLDWIDPGLGFCMWRLWKCIFIVIFGAVVCVIGTYTNAKGLFEEVYD